MRATLRRSRHQIEMSNIITQTWLLRLHAPLKYIISPAEYELCPLDRLQSLILDP